MLLTLGTSDHYRFCLVWGKVEFLDQAWHILMEELVTDFGLFKYVWQRGHLSWDSKGISPPVSLCDEPQYIRVRPCVHNIKWLLPVGNQL